MAKPIRIVKTYRLPPHIVEAIAQIAHEDDMDNTDVIIEALEMYIERREKRKAAKEGSK